MGRRRDAHWGIGRAHFLERLLSLVGEGGAFPYLRDVSDARCGGRL